MPKEREAKSPKCHTIYMIHYHEEDTPPGVVREWFTTFAKAQRRLKQLKLQDSKEVRAMSVPRTKLALAAFLNVWAEVG
jgi:hypothetical protein